MKFNQTTAPTTGATPGSPSPLTELDASGNPNYPAAVKGDRYRITVAGKVGGASGKVVEAGDVIEAVADNAGGTEAAVGTSWIAMQANIAGMTAAGLAMITAANAAAQQALVGITGGGILATGGFTLTVPATGTAALLGRVQTFTAANIFSANGADSTPALSVTGAVFTGGSATTTKPLFLVEPAGTTSTGWNTAGTLMGGNAPSGFLGRILDAQLNGVSVFRINYNGNITADPGSYGSFVIGTASGSNGNTTLSADGGGQVFLAGAAIVSYNPFTQRGTAGFGTARNSRFRFATSDNDDDGSVGAIVCSGSGSPEGAKTAPPGSIYLNQAGGSATTLYKKESGTGNTGWTAVL